MGSLILKNSFRFIFFLLLQGLLLQGLTINYPILNNTNIIIYPIVILLLPLRTPSALILLLAFALGLILDIFYNTPGIHAATTVLTAYLRPFILAWIEPRGGYTVEASPTIREYGSKWFLIYSSVLMGIHLFVLFSIQAFTFVYISEIFTKTILSFLVSMMFILAYMFLANPKE